MGLIGFVENWWVGLGSVLKCFDLHSAYDRFVISRCAALPNMVASIDYVVNALVIGGFRFNYNNEMSKELGAVSRRRNAYL